MKLILKIKSKDELQKCYKDSLGDFWESKNAFKEWQDVLGPIGKMYCCYKEETGQIIDFYENNNNLNEMMWSIKEIYPKEKYPEYYL